MYRLVSRVLIVDDEKTIGEMFQEHMEAAGYICFTAYSAEAALELLLTQEVDIAIVDISMPGIGGLALFKQIMARYPQVAVIFVTAVEDVDVAVHSLKLGAYDYLVKPVTLKRLQQAVEEALHRRNTALGSKEQHTRSEDQGQQLAQKARELTALNRLFQNYLKERLAVEEASRNILSKLASVAQEMSSLHELVRKPVQVDPESLVNMELEKEKDTADGLPVSSPPRP